MKMASQQTSTPQRRFTQGQSEWWLLCQFYCAVNNRLGLQHVTRWLQQTDEDDAGSLKKREKQRKSRSPSWSSRKWRWKVAASWHYLLHPSSHHPTGGFLDLYPCYTGIWSAFDPNVIRLQWGAPNVIQNSPCSATISVAVESFNNRTLCFSDAATEKFHFRTIMKQSNVAADLCSKITSTQITQVSTLIWWLSA